jgi:hypothetical protein
MDESLSSLYARADALRHQIDEGSAEDMQVSSRCALNLMSSLKYKTASFGMRSVNNLSNDWPCSARMKVSMM